MALDNVLLILTGFVLTWLGSSLLDSKPHLWGRDVAFPGILLTVFVFCLLLRNLPGFSQTMTKTLRALIGPCVLATGVLLAVCAIYGALSPDASGQLLPFFSALYNAIQFFSLGADPAALGARWSFGEHLVAALAVIFFLGIATQGIGLLFHASLEAARLRWASNHFVICGIGRIGHQLAEDLIARRRERRTIVVIESNAEHPDIPWLRDNGVIVINGQAQRREVLQKTRVAKAREVFVVTGSDEINVECVIEIRDQLRHTPRRERRLHCYVNLRDGDLADSMRERLLKHAKQCPMDIDVFNPAERTVRRLFESLVSEHLDRLPMKDEEVAHFVIIGFGAFGQSLALSLAELAHFPNCKRVRMTIVDRDIDDKKKAFLARYPRFTDINPKNHKDNWTNGIRGGIEFVCNATFESLSDVGEERWVTTLDRKLTGANVKPLVFVCFDDDRVNFKCAERLKKARDRLGDLFNQQTGQDLKDPLVREHRWPIYVWIPSQRELSDMLESTSAVSDPAPFGRCFGDVSYTEITGSWVDKLAMLLQLGYSGFDGKDNDVGERWLDLCSLIPGLPCRQKPPDRAQHTWESHLQFAYELWQKQSELFRASDRSAAIHAVVKLAALGLAVSDLQAAPSQEASQEAEKLLAQAKSNNGIPVAGDVSTANSTTQAAPHVNLNKLPIMEHYRWCAERLLAGWRYQQEPPGQFTSLRKDMKERKLEHWNLVTYGKLGNAIQLDYQPVHIVLALAASNRLFSVRKIKS